MDLWYIFKAIIYIFTRCFIPNEENPKDLTCAPLPPLFSQVVVKSSVAIYTLN